MQPVQRAANDDTWIHLFVDGICVANVPELRKMILEEGHRSNLSIHPDATNMYQDLKMMFWGPNMKREVSEFVYACLAC